MSSIVHVFLLFSLCVGVGTTLFSQVEFEWVKQFKGEGSNVGRCITTDDEGNVYVAGGFFGTMNVGMGPSLINLTSASGLTRENIFIAKFTAGGDLIWAKAMGGNDNFSRALSISVDASGNIYSTGFFKGSADFDPGTGDYILSGGGTFISKLDSEGNFIWAKSIRSSKGQSLTIDAHSNIYITGNFKGSVDFDPLSSNSYMLHSENNSADVFILKLDSSGDFIWAKRMGGPGEDYGYAIAVDNLGNVHTTGHFNGVADFDPGQGSFHLTSSSRFKMFVSKLDTDGNFIFAKKIGNSLFISSNSIVVDAFGNIYTSGFFKGTTDFNPGSATYNLTSSGGNSLTSGSDIFLSKLDVNGDFVWAQVLGSNWYGAFEHGNTLALDKQDNIYLIGTFKGNIDIGNLQLNSEGSYDLFITKINTIGSIVWVKKIGGDDYDEGHSIAVDNCGNVFTTGIFNSTSEFDPDSGSYMLTSAQGWDIFVHKIGVDTCYYIDLGPDRILCEGDSLMLIAKIASDDKVLWSTGDTVPAILVKQSGIYHITVTTPTNVISDTITVTFYPKPTVYIGPDTAFCGLVDYIIQSHSTHADSYVWNTGDTTKTLHVKDEGFYSLMVSNIYSCSNADTIYIDKIDYPYSNLHDTSICGKNIYTLDAGNSGSNYLWSNGDTTRAIMVYEDGTYHVIISNGYCSITDSVHVKFLPETDCITYIFIPNAFSPGNDDLNDTFGPHGSRIKNYQMNIYDRWGELIYRTIDGKPWDGRYKGQVVAEGLYIYLITIDGNDGKVSNYKGNISLIR